MKSSDGNSAARIGTGGNETRLAVPIVRLSLVSRVSQSAGQLLDSITLLKEMLRFTRPASRNRVLSRGAIEHLDRLTSRGAKDHHGESRKSGP